MQVLNERLKSSSRLLFFFLCESTMLRDDDRKLDVTGLLSSYVFSGTTDAMPPSTLTLSAVVGIHSNDRDDIHTLKITGHEQGKPEQELPWTAQTDLINGEPISIVRRPCDLRISQPGTYWFNAYLNGETVGRYPLTIRYSRTDGPHD